MAKVTKINVNNDENEYVLGTFSDAIIMSGEENTLTDELKIYQNINYKIGGYYNSSGTIVNNPDYGYSEGIRVTPSTSIIWNTGGSSTCYLRRLDTTTAVVQQAVKASSTKQTVEIGSRTSIIQISFPLSKIDEVSITDTEGNIIYKPFNPSVKVKSCVENSYEILQKLDATLFTSLAGYTLNNSHYWVASENSIIYYFSVAPNEKIRIKNNKSSVLEWCLVTSVGKSGKASFPDCGNLIGKYKIEAYDYVDIDLSKLNVLSYLIYISNTTLGTTAADIYRVKELANNINDINAESNIIAETNTLDINSYPNVKVYVSTNEGSYVWDNTTTSNTTKFIPVYPNKTYKITAAKRLLLSVLKDDSHDVGETINAIDSYEFLRLGQNDSVIITMPSDAAFIALRSNGIYANASIIGYNDFSPTRIKSLIANTQNEVDSVEKTLDEVISDIGIKTYFPKYGNGTYANGGNTSCIRNDNAIFAKKGDKITIVVKKPLEEGHFYKYGFCESKVSNAFYNLTSNILRQVEYSNNTNNVFAVENSNCVAVCVCVAEYVTVDSTTSLVKLQPASQYADGELFVVKVETAKEDGKKSTEEVIEIRESLLRNIYNNDFYGIIQNYYITSNDTQVASSSYLISHFIPVSEGDVVEWGTGVVSSIACIDTYTKSKSYKSYYTANALKRTITVGSNVGYIRASIYKNNYDSYVKVNGKYAIYYDEYFARLFSIYRTAKVSDEEIRDLVAASQYGKLSNTGRNIQFCMVSDSHSDNNSVNNAIRITNECDFLDFVIHCGDIVGSNFTDSVATTDKTNFNTSYGLSKKPMFIVIGNHDVGNSKTVSLCANHEEAYSQWIKPMVDAGLIPENTEEQPNADVSHPYHKNYYYKDFASYKLRMIVLYEFDDNLDLVEGSSTTYRIQRGMRVIRQEQAQWFLDSLESTPAGYRIVVALHQAWSKNNKVVASKFSQKNVNKLTPQSHMESDFIADAVNAYMNKEVFDYNVVFDGDASYLNTFTDDSWKSYAYNVNKDFSSVQGIFHCYIGGHSHKDVVLQHTIYPKQKQVIVIDANSTYYRQSINNDIRRINIVTNTDTNKQRNKITHPALNCLTTVSVDANLNMIRLTKLGIRRTDSGDARDIEAISIDKELTPNSISTFGTDLDRPILTNSNIGFQYYDTTLNKVIVWNGSEWTNLDGTTLS